MKNIIHCLFKSYNKPKIKLTNIEKGFIELTGVEEGFDKVFKTCYFLMKLQEKDMFKDVPCDLTLKEILERAVIENND